jgi:hypothetical protein
MMPADGGAELGTGPQADGSQWMLADACGDAAAWTAVWWQASIDATRGLELPLDGEDGCGPWLRACDAADAAPADAAPDVALICWMSSSGRRRVGLRIPEPRGWIEEEGDWTDTDWRQPLLLQALSPLLRWMAAVFGPGLGDPGVFFGSDDDAPPPQPALCLQRSFALADDTGERPLTLQLHEPGLAECAAAAWRHLGEACDAVVDAARPTAEGCGLLVPCGTAMLPQTMELRPMIDAIDGLGGAAGACRPEGLEAGGGLVLQPEAGSHGVPLGLRTAHGWLPVALLAPRQSAGEAEDGAAAEPAADAAAPAPAAPTPRWRIDRLLWTAGALGAAVPRPAEPPSQLQVLGAGWWMDAAALQSLHAGCVLPPGGGGVLLVCGGRTVGRGREHVHNGLHVVEVTDVAA